MSVCMKRDGRGGVGEVGVGGVLVKFSNPTLKELLDHGSAHRWRSSDDNVHLCDRK